jgi:hypothetical protein
MMAMQEISDRWKWIIGLGIASLALSGLERLRRVYKLHQSETWPISYGQVNETSVHEARYETLLIIQYSYPVPTESYAIPAEFRKEFSSSQDAWIWAEALNEKAIPVRYNPSNPWKSILWDSDLQPIVDALPLPNPLTDARPGPKGVTRWFKA